MPDTSFPTVPDAGSFQRRLSGLRNAHDSLVSRSNEPLPEHNGVYRRYRYPVLTAAHAPIEWRFDLNPESNPFLMERLGVNAAFNPGAILHDGRYVLVVRAEGTDRKSFFALADSEFPTHGFRFREEPILLPETDNPDVNVYDMRLTRHEDGYIYGVFCTERKDPDAPPGDTSSAYAQAGIVRTRDLKTWERLPDLKTASPQQRNVVLHPEFVDGKYAFYTRPQDGFIEAGSGGGIGFGLCDDITNPAVDDEQIIEQKEYHTIKESKNGQGPAPIRTRAGWLHLAHGVRGTAAGLRYVLYIFMSDADQPWKVTHRPGGYFIAPEGEERVGDVSNVTFCNGWIAEDDGRIWIYYASSDTRIHVAETSVERLLDYAMNTPEDGLRSGASVRQRIDLIRNNRK